MEKISPPVRILALVLVLVGAAGMLALRFMGPSDEPVALPAPVPKAAAAPQQASAAGGVPVPAKAATKPAPAKTAKPTPTAKPKPAAKPEPALPKSGFPVVVDKALAQHDVVVLSLVVPGVRTDELAAAEAEAGAKLGGAGFLALNVLNEGVARALLTKLDAVKDPSVLVLKGDGEIALELTGFVDRDTVAQAAANASS